MAIVSAIVLVVCGVSIVQRIAQDNEANRENQEMAGLAYTITPVLTATPEPYAGDDGVPRNRDPDALSHTAARAAGNRLAALHRRTGDFSWIKVDGTQIDYPVLCRVGDDAYYHTHTVKGKRLLPDRSTFRQVGISRTGRTSTP